MRSLFCRAEKPQYVSAAPAALTNETAASGAQVKESEATLAGLGSRTKAARVRRVYTPQERLVQRRRRLALLTIVASLAVGGRWYVANREPNYPGGEGVYSFDPAPEWGKMKQPNAAMFYMAATDALDKDALREVLRTTKEKSSDLTHESLPMRKAAIEVAKPALALLRQGMQYPYFVDAQTNYFKSNLAEGKGLERPVINFIALRDLGRLLATEASIHAAEGRHAEAVSASLDSIRLGVDQARGRTLMDGMIGVMIQGMGAKSGVQYVAELSPGDARSAALRLEKILVEEPSFAQIMTAERDTMAYETLRNLFSSGSQGYNPITNTASKGQMALGAMSFIYTKQGLVNDFARQYNKILSRVKKPYYQAVHSPAVTPSANPIVNRWVVGNYNLAFRETVRNATWNRVLLTQLAVQAYQGEHSGAFPVSLSQLTEGANPYLNLLPTDPFSQTGADPLRYNPETGAVYSVGYNGLDNRMSEDDNAELYKKRSDRKL